MGHSGCAVKVESREDFAGGERSRMSEWRGVTRKGVAKSKR